MKNVIFVIHRLGAGGAEKSLVSLMNSLPLYDVNVHLMAIDPTGIFRSQVPSGVHLVEAPKELICQSARITSRLFWRNTSFKLVLLKIFCIICCRLRGKESKSKRSHDQFYNDFWKRIIPDYSDYYDVAVSYMDCVNYYVVDHIKAGRKILWCHNDYNKLEYVASYDRQYYEKADYICTISQSCKDSLITNFPTLENKFMIVENISSIKIINNQSDITDEMVRSGDGFMYDKRFKILSIGRITEQKGFDYAIEATKLLKERKIEFCWYIIGEGPLRKSLETVIQKQELYNCIKFIGIRSNPYAYMKRADIFVMPSRYEGKSIALDEAKILCKPIVITNYPSAKDAIIDGKNGIITDISAKAIAKGILELYYDQNLRETFERNLKAVDYSNQRQVVATFMELI